MASSLIQPYVDPENTMWAGTVPKSESNKKSKLFENAVHRHPKKARGKVFGSQIAANQLTTPRRALGTLNIANRSQLTPTPNGQTPAIKKKTDSINIQKSLAKQPNQFKMPKLKLCEKVTPQNGELLNIMNDFKTVQISTTDEMKVKKEYGEIEKTFFAEEDEFDVIAPKSERVEAYLDKIHSVRNPLYMPVDDDIRQEHQFKEQFPSDEYEILLENTADICDMELPTMQDIDIPLLRDEEEIDQQLCKSNEHYDNKDRNEHGDTGVCEMKISSMQQIDISSLDGLCQAFV